MPSSVDKLRASDELLTTQEERSFGSPVPRLSQWPTRSQPPLKLQDFWGLGTAFFALNNANQARRSPAVPPKRRLNHQFSVIYGPLPGSSLASPRVILALFLRYFLRFLALFLR